MQKTTSLRRAKALADRYGEIDRQIKALQAEQKDAKEELVAFMSDTGSQEVTGRGYRISACLISGVRLDAGRVKACLSPQQLAACSITTESLRFTVQSI